VPPWEVAGGSDVPPWEELPPDLPMIGPYDVEPAFAPPPASRYVPQPRAESRPAAPAVPNDSQARPVAVQAATPAAAPSAADDGTPPVFTGEWPSLAASLPLKGLAQQLAYQSELVRVVGRTVSLRAPVAAITEGGTVERLQQALTDHFGVPVRVQCEVGAVAQTAAAADAQARAERQREAEATIDNDPFVQGLLREFGGQIVPGSIQPRAA
jgi:DNA polymerase-3 subunit gamma/tau